MRRVSYVRAALAMLVATSAALAAPPSRMEAAMQALAPPVAARVPHVVQSPQGEREDPYYWLRDDDPKAKRPELMAWLEAENAYTDAVLAPLADLRATLKAELKSRLKDDEAGPPAYADGWWFWQVFKPGSEYPLLMRRRGSPERPDPRAAAEVLLDQPARAQGQPFYKVGGWSQSLDGRYLAWTEDTAGRRIHTLRVRDLQRGVDLPDALPGVLEQVVWAADGKTLFYIRQDPVTLQSGPVWRHRVGTPAEADVRVYDEADKTQFVSLYLSASRRFVVIRSGGHDSAETLAVDARRPATPPQKVFARLPGVRHRADHLDGRWVLRTNEDAPDFRLIAAPQSAPDDRRRWRTLLPARDDASVENFTLLDRGIAVQERVQGAQRVRLLDRAGRWRTVAEGDGAAVALGHNEDPRAAHLRYTVQSMVQPLATWDWHLASGRRVLRQQREVPGYDAMRYATRRLWTTARDGRRVPVTLAWRPDLARDDGRSPLLVSGYGAYGYSYDPVFSSYRVSLLDRGFVVAIAHVRGGADLGQRWYEDGRLLNKRHSFDDFVDATEGLLKAGWGDRARVFASGGSAGGLLMGAVANQAPQLYRGMVLDVPFVDVVTTMLDESIPLTVNEWSQWGDPREKAAYDYILSYSPYDNLRAQDYPAMLVTTGLWDSQVQYYEPAKYVARLRTLRTDARPLLLAVNMSAGHGGASGRYAVLDEVARFYAFVLDLAGVQR